MLFEKILIFICFLSPLVFFHELGHYLFARLFGVRVETFSIGFGPKILKIKKGFTEYAISLIPLGGYIKMYGDDLLEKDNIPVSQRKYSFNHKSKWARFWIVFGGPLANFILAFFLFFFLALGGQRVPEIRVGHIYKESLLFKKGILSGDVLYKVNGKKIVGLSDVLFEENALINSVTVKRRDKQIKLDIDLVAKIFLKELMSNPRLLRKPILIDSKGDNYILSIDKDKYSLDVSLEELSQVDVNKLYLFKIINKKDNQSDYVVDKKSISIPIKNDLWKPLNRNGFYSLDTIVASVSMGSAADKSGIKGGDIITSIDGNNIYSFYQIRGRLEKSKGSITLGILRNGKLLNFSLTPDEVTRNKKKVKIIGVYSAGEYLRAKFIELESQGLVNSFLVSFPKTKEGIVKTINSFKTLILGETSFRNIGGPLAIGKVASDSFNTSLSYFFELMALISIHLGIINLFPIPILDGGHIMFIILEIINRKPLSRRKMEIAQQLGLSFLLMLMIGAIFNDVTRFF